MTGTEKVFRAFKRLGLVALGAGLAAMLIFFALQNPQAVRLHFFKWESAFEVPVWLIVIVSLLIGFVLPSVVLIGVLIRDIRIMRRQRKHLSRMEQELNKLRNLPLEGEVIPEDEPEEQGMEGVENEVEQEDSISTPPMEGGKIKVTASEVLSGK